MRLKNIIILILIICIFGISGCGKADVNGQMVLNYAYNDVLQKNIFVDDKDILNFPCDIACDKDYIYVVNQGNDNILLFNNNTELVNSFGTTGQENGEFVNPEAIAVTDNYIYVVEKNGCRIQIFNKSLEFQKEIIIDKLKKVKYVEAYDIEADNNGNIYLSVIGMQQKLLKIYAIDSEGKVNDIGKNLIGVMGKDQKDNIYYTQSFEPIKDGYQDGQCYVSSIDNKIKKVFDLPDKYSPVALCLTDMKIYLFSYSQCQIDEFSRDGNYIQTLYREDATTSNANMKHMALYNNSFYMTDSSNNIIYSLMPKVD